MATGAEGAVDRAMRRAQEALDKWAAETPPVTRALHAAVLALFVLQQWVGSFGVATVPLFVVNKLEVHRLLFSPLFERGLLGMFFALLWLSRSGKALEKRLSSRSFALLLLQVAVSINVVFCAMMVALYRITRSKRFMVHSCQGLVPTSVALLLVFPAHGNVSLMFLPVSMPAKYAPFVMVALFFVLSGGAMPFDFIAALAVGSLYGKVAALPGLGDSDSGGATLPRFATPAAPPTTPAVGTTSPSAPAPAPAAKDAAARAAARAAMLEAAEARIDKHGPAGPGP